MLDLLDRRTDLHRAATHWAEPVESVEQGLAVLDAHRSHFAFDDPRLVHGDLGVDHILISDNRVTGIIDFQECSGNHPLLDLAHWELTHHHLVPTAELLTGYQRAGPVDIATGPLFALALLRESLWMLLVRAEQRLGHDIEVYRTALHQQLAQFRPGTGRTTPEVEDGTTRSE
jgi:aminoglycoside phosphotransferase (APT) family kinase protein